MSLVGVGFSGSVLALAVAMTVLAVGNGMMRPPNLGIISLLSPVDEQGSVMGVTNSLASLGRIIGPVLGGFFYDGISRSSPFFFAGILAALASLIVFVEFRKLPT